MKFTNSIRTSMCITVLTLLLTISSFAQAPEKMSYQAVIRDAENALVTNQQVGMQISILQGDVAVYEETQTPTSNTNGLVSLEIGEGTVISGSFTAIDWSADTSFIKIETDPSGGSNYTITGTSQLLSVPYALYAKTSSDASAVAVNTSKVGYTEALVSANTAVAANTLKVGYTEALVSANSAVAANTAKVGSTGLSGLSDALVETNSLYIGNDPSAVTDNAEYNVAIGTTALSSNTTGDRNTAIGYYALSSNTTGKNNTANGNDALRANTEGNYNTANGNEALKANTEGSANTAIGNEALLSNTTGGYNTASGYEALRANTTGGGNTASGNSALKSNTPGPENTAIGTGALISNTEGRANTASGLSALKSNTTGGYNTASGREALTSNTTGDFNTAIGFQADVVANNLTNATAIGNGALVASSNTMQLGNRSITDVLTSGKITASGFINSSIYLVNTYYEELGGYVIEISASGKHGIVVAMQDQGPSDWYSANDLLSDPTKHDPAGAEFLDWRLPAKRELDLIFEQRVAVGNFTTNYYWSFTESTYNGALAKKFDSLGNDAPTNKTQTFYVRAVRAF